MLTSPPSLLPHLNYDCLRGIIQLVHGDGDHRRDVRSLRLTCQAYQHLVDACTTTVTCALTATAPVWLHKPNQQQCADDGPTPTFPAPITPDIQPLQRLLQRLPLLDTVSLSGWASEPALLSRLMLFGRATEGQRGPPCLHLTGTSLSASTLSVVRLALPHVCKLRVVLSSYSPATLDINTFESLQDSLLTKFSFRSFAWAEPDTPPQLRHLHNLSRLVSLELAIRFMPDEELHHLGGLVGLEHCFLGWAYDAHFGANFVPLLSGSRRLQSLQLHGWQCNPARVDPPSALRLLVTLPDLRCLDLGAAFVVDLATWPHLCAMTQLTRLGVGGIAVTGLSGGHLPLLQHLAIGLSEWDTRDTLPNLGRSLLPLLPLPSLVTLDLRYPSHGHGHGPGAEEAAAAALLAFARHVAAAPHLRLGGNWGFCTDNDHRLTQAQLASAMQPLAGRLTWTMNAPGTDVYEFCVEIDGG